MRTRNYPEHAPEKWEMYKEYNKLKAAKEHLTVLVAQGEAQLDYLNSVMSELQCAESEKDLADIRLELISSG